MKFALTCLSGLSLLYAAPALASTSPLISSVSAQTTAVHTVDDTVIKTAKVFKKKGHGHSGFKKKGHGHKSFGKRHISKKHIGKFKGHHGGVVGKKIHHSKSIHHGGKHHVKTKVLSSGSHFKHRDIVYHDNYVRVYDMKTGHYTRYMKHDYDKYYKSY